MNNNLESQAKKLAAQAYHLVIKEDQTTEDEPIFVVNYLEMPGCRAQGEDIEEAVANLKELTYEYILSYLENGVSVPQPYTATTATSGGILMLSHDDNAQNPASHELSELSVFIA